MSTPRCEELFETLSAWVDGEAAPEEARALEAHLAGCPGCREVEGALRRVAGVALPPVPAGFAGRTAGRVLERAGRSWTVRLGRGLRRAAGWFDRLGAGLEAGAPHPLAALLQTRAARAGVRPPSFWLGLALLAYGLPALVLGASGHAESGRFFLMAAGLGLLAALPYYHFRSDVSLLVALRRGRCLEEILSSGLPAQGIADALARYSLTSLLRVGWPVTLVLLAGTTLFPLEEQGLAALAAVLWLPLTGVVFAVGSYAVQAVVLYSRGGEGASPASVAAASALALPAAGFLALAGHEAGLGQWTGAAGALLAVVLWVGGLGRWLACWGLEHASTVERWTRNGRIPVRNRWVRAWGDNPIVVREARRLGAAVPLGLAGLFLVRLAPALLPAGALWAFTELDPRSWTAAWWIGAAVLGWLLFLRAAAGTSSAVAAEREAGTLETLVQSGLTSRDFVTGWLRVACLPLYLELAVTAALAFLLAGLVPEAVAEVASESTLTVGGAVLTVAVLAVMPWAGAWVGLGVSSRCVSRREAGGQVVGACLQTLGAWLVGAALLTAALSVATLAFRLDPDPDVWGALTGLILPAAALGLVAVWAAARGRMEVERRLTARWGEVPEVDRAPADTGHRRLLLGPAFVAVLALGVQAGITLALVVVSGVFRLGPAPAAALGLLTGLAVALSLWWLVRPLLEAVADRAGQTLAGASALAGVLGAAAGAAVGTVPAMVRLLTSAGLVNRSGLESASATEALLWAAGLGFLMAASVAAAAFVARPPAASLPTAGLGPALRRTGAAFLGLAALLAAGFAVLSHLALNVQVEQPDLARRVLEDSHAREAARLSHSPDEDGFALLAPALMSREKDTANVPPRVRQTLESLKALSWSAMGDREDILKALREEPDKAAESAARLDAVLPLVRQVVARPHFVAPPRQADGIAAQVPNFIAMRGLSQSLVSRALLLEEEGRLDEALDLHLLNVDWSDQMAGQGPIIHGMITIAMTAIAQEGLLDFLNRHRDRLDRADWERTLAALERSTLTLAAFQNCVDDEFAFAARAFEDAARGRFDLDSGLEVMNWMPAAWIERERRVYTNLYLRQREAMRAGSTTAVLQVEQGITEGGEHATFSLAYVLLPNLSRAWLQARLADTRQEALKAMCRVELFHAAVGRYPEHGEVMNADGDVDGNYVYDPSAGESESVPLGRRGRVVVQRSRDGMRLYIDPFLGDSYTPGGRFLYQRTRDGYRLYTQSPLLKRVGYEVPEIVWVPRKD